MGTKRLLPFELANTDGTLTSANQISTIPDDTGGFSNVETALTSSISRISAIENTAFNSGRSFIRFNDGFTIDRNNLATFEDKNIIYTAKNDKLLDTPTRPDVVLPNDTEIQASGETYPITFEFTHLGGTAVFTDRNIVRFIIDGVIQTEQLVRDQVAIITKTGVGVDYDITVGGFDPSDTILPTGVFNLKTDTPITDISTIATELSAVTIVAGDSYLVETGGTWSGLTIPDNSILVAIVNTASLVDSPTNDDWLLLDNPRVNAKSSAFLANLEQDGIRFNSNRNVQVDPANVITIENMATGTPIVREIGGNTQGQGRSIIYANVPIQMADLIGGRLQLNMNFNISRTSGFAPELVTMRIEYPGGIQFDFPLNGAPINGVYTQTIDIPNVDYSSALNQNATVSLFYNFSGVSFFGEYTLTGLVNTSTGRLHDVVNFLATNIVIESESRTTGQIDALRGTVNQEDATIEALAPRVSPYKQITTQSPDVYARFLNSTGADSFPSTVETLSQVDASNPRFTGNNVALFVAVRPGGAKTLLNITQSTSIPLDASLPNVELNESLTGLDSFVYFIYRVNGLTASDVYEVEDNTFSQVVAWSDDITNLEADIERIDAELEHALLNLSDEVVQVLENELTVTEEDTPSVVPSDYNNSLGTGGTQKIFFENNPNTAVGGVLNSKPISENSGNTNRFRNKLLYIPETTYTNQTYVTAFDGVTSRDLITYLNGRFFAKVFVPEVPQGTSISTIYPAPSNLVSGAGIWQTIPALTFQNGVPVPEADEIFFTRNIPSSALTLTIQYRGHANGNIFGSGTTTLANVGGANDVFTSFTLDDGGETVDVEVRYYANTRRIRVTTIDHVRTGLPTINDVQVILSYQETRTVPAVPASTRDVEIEFENTGFQIFGFKPSTNNLVIVGDRTEIDTGYTYTTLFGASENGYLSVTSTTATFLDYQNIDVIDSTITDLESHASLPQFGLFTTEYTHETITHLDTQLTVKTSDNNTVNLGNEIVKDEILGFTIDSVGNNEYPILIRTPKNIKVSEINIWHPGSTGQLTLQLKKNGTNEGSAISTTNGAISTTSVNIDLATNDSFTADITSVIAITKPVSIQIKYKTNLN